MKTLFLIVLMYVVLQFSFFSAHSQSTEIDSLVKETFDKHSITGLAIAVIKTDTFLFKKGYGYENIENKKLVDDNTNFYIASLTKAMTAYGIGMLVDSKMLNWNDPISNYLNNIQFNEPYSNMVTISDLLSMNLGSPHMDTLINYPKLSENVLLEEINLHHLPNFRNSNYYGQGANTGFYLAGKIIESVSGIDYTEFLTDSLLKPLKMNNTYFSNADSTLIKKCASPYKNVDGTIMKLHYPHLGHYMSAAGIISNTNDLSNWLKLILEIDFHKTLLNDETINKLFYPHNILEKNNTFLFNPYSLYNLYGYGWVLSEYKGNLLAEHLGVIEGYTNLIAVIPEEKIGIVILTNYSSDNIIIGLRDLKFGIIEHLKNNYSNN